MPPMEPTTKKCPKNKLFWKKKKKKHLKRKLGQGRDAVKALIKDNPELADELEEKIKAKIKENNA